MAGVYWNTGVNSHCPVSYPPGGRSQGLALHRWPLCSLVLLKEALKWVSEHLGILCIWRALCVHLGLPHWLLEFLQVVHEHGGEGGESK